MKKTFKMIIVIVILGIIAYFYINNYMENSLQAVDNNDENKILIEIPEGSSTSEIAEILATNDLIKNPGIFKYYTKKTNFDSKLKAGNFMLSRNMNTDELIEALIKGGTSGNTVNITIIEGLTLEETAQSIAGQLGLSYEKLISLMDNGDKYKEEYKFLMDNPNIKRLQGYLMPETYNVYVNSSEEDIIKKLLSQFDAFYQSEMEPLLVNSNSNLNFEEIINLASIVEKEAVLDEERDEVAATFLNRLDINMKLQSCATVNYAHGEWKERLTNEDLAIDSPFNTYIVEGLPPSPINSPGKISIKSVLEPADVDYLYFVAKGDGSHYFSNNYEDHLAAKNKYLN